MTKKAAEKLIYCYRDTTDTDGEARAASGLGEVYLQMGEFDKAMHYHQMAYDISENHEDMDGKVIILDYWFIKIAVWLWLNFEQGTL